MIATAVDWLTIGTSQWYETLPLLCGSVFLVVELIVRIARQRRPWIAPGPLIYAFGEGSALATLATFAPALQFAPDLARAIADKNNKILIAGCLMAIISIVRHLIDGWVQK